MCIRDSFKGGTSIEFPHRTRANVGFADGHVGDIGQTSFADYADDTDGQPGIRFWYGDLPHP